MNIKKTLLYSTAGLITAIGLVACGSSSSLVETPPIAELPPPPPPAADPQGDCPTVGNIEPVEVSAGQCTITGVLDQDATLTADMTWFLDDRLQIGNNQFNASLSIEAGTQIRGSGTDHILVWPGSTILANGTSAEPIQMLLSLIHISEPTRPY